MDKENWHLDKRIPIGLFIGLIAQTLAVGYWLSSVDSRITSLERFEASIGVSRPITQARLGTVEGSVQVLTAQSRDLGSRLDRIEDKLDRVIEQLP